MRTQEEIVARIGDVADVDFFGFKLEVLIGALDFEHARPFIKPDVTAAEWDKLRESDTDAAARNYYRFALGKIEGHRGISASRSVDKLTEYAWLLGRDDVVDAMAAADHAQYGAPKAKAFGAGFGEDWPSERWAVRMAEGLPCEPGCEMGCEW